MAQDVDSRRLADAAQRLAEAGFDRVGQTDSPWFGDMSIEMQRGAWHVTLSRDKGHLFLVMSASADGGHDVALWESCIDRILPSLDPREFELDVDALIRRLPDLEKLDVDDIARVTDCLRSNGRWRFITRRNLGMIKPPSA